MTKSKKDLLSISIICITALLITLTVCYFATNRTFCEECHSSSGLNYPSPIKEEVSVKKAGSQATITLKTINFDSLIDVLCRDCTDICKEVCELSNAGIIVCEDEGLSEQKCYDLLAILLEEGKYKNTDVFACLNDFNKVSVSITSIDLLDIPLFSCGEIHEKDFAY